MLKLKKAVILMLSVCLVLASTPVLAVTAASDVFEYTVNDDNTVTITDYLGSDAAVTIPAQIDGLDVTVIGANAFSNVTSIESVTFPDTLKTIEKSAFEACTGLKSLTFPNSLETVGDFAFFNCTSLSSITSTPYLYTIGYQAFHNTSWLVNADNGFLFVGRVLYCYKGVVETSFSITVPDFTAAIACNAFENQYKVTTIYLPVGLRSIGKFAFKNCYALTEIRIPPTVTSIGNYAFLNADGVMILGVDGSAADSFATEQDIVFAHDETLDHLDGDMDKDGVVTSTDIRLLMRAIVLSEITDHERYLSCDIVFDGKIATSDVREWLKLTIA